MRRPPNCGRSDGGGTMHSVLFIYFLVLLSLSSNTEAQRQQRQSDLLNAYRVSLSTLTSPNTYYFLEFPISPDIIDTDYLSPKCGNDTPFSFMYKRGTDEHLSKLIVEFEGSSPNHGVSRSGSTTSTCEGRGQQLQVPWYESPKSQYNEANDDDPLLDIFPPLNSCTGIGSGFVKHGAE